MECHIVPIVVGWELESVDVFMELLFSNLPSRVEDRKGWRQSKNGNLSYGILRGPVGR